MFDTIAWIAQGFLALFFFAAGVPKLADRGMQRWVGFEDLPRALTFLIGVSEVVGAVALVAPMIVDRYTWTTPLAALGIAAVSLMASGFHVRCAEWLAALETALWACLGIVVALVRRNELASAPALTEGVLMAAAVVLVPAIIGNLALLFRSPPAPTRPMPTGEKV